MVGRAGEIGVREGDAPERSAAQYLAWRGLAVSPEEEAGLRTAERVSPAIEDDACDVALGIEAGTREHVVELLADASLVFAIGRPQQLGAALRPLFIGRQAGIEERHIKSQDGWRIRPEGLPVAPERDHLADFRPVADPFEPAPAGDAELIKEPPVSQRDVRDHVRRAMKLRVGVAMR